MATVTFIRAKTQSKTAMGKVMAYCSRNDKTLFEGYHLISGKDCCGETAFKEFMATKQQHGKANGMFFYQYVQSFSPGEIAPDKAHEIGLKFAGKCFPGHEVLVATHTDREHIHTHLVINSVGFESGKKLQMARGSIHDLRRHSDEICREYGLTIVQPAQKNNLQTREYRAALKGESWKFKLIGAIDLALESARTRAEFIKKMQRMGYGVTWSDTRKHITYTTPDSQKCRDIKLHDEKYLKENMEIYFGQRQVEGPQPARKPAAQLPAGGAAVRDPAGNLGEFAEIDHGNCPATGPNTGANQPAANLGRRAKRDRPGHRSGAGGAEIGPAGWPMEHRKRDQQKLSGAADETFADHHRRDEAPGTAIANAGFYPAEDQVHVVGSGHGPAADLVGLALDLQNLIEQPAEKEEQPSQPREKHRQKHSMDMSL